LDADEIHTGRHAAKGVSTAVGCRSAAGDDPGDVRAMAIVVVRSCQAIDQITEADDVGIEIRAGRDARVDHRDADTGPGDAVIDAGDIRADALDVVVPARLHAA